MNKFFIGTTACLLLHMGSSLSVAWALDGPADRRGRIGPPPEAIEACNGKEAGTAVEFKTPRGDMIKAICKQIDGQVAAVPEGGFRGPKGTPPSGTRGGE
jgi:hypothetical protein